MADETTASAFHIKRPVSLRYYPNYCAYRYRVLSSLDISERLGRTDLYFDAIDNHIVLRHYPTHQHTGNTVTNWLYALHTARVFGLPYRVFVCALIWWRRRR
jgi:uncharacterized iron-regulated membrane protein